MATETAALPDAPWLEPIDFVVYKDLREMARQARFRDVERISLSDQEVYRSRRVSQGAHRYDFGFFSFLRHPR